jgi:hypothetical protein
MKWALAATVPQQPRWIVLRGGRAVTAAAVMLAALAWAGVQLGLHARTDNLAAAGRIAEKRDRPAEAAMRPGKSFGFSRPAISTCGPPFAATPPASAGRTGWRAPFAGNCMIRSENTKHPAAAGTSNGSWRDTKD